jgi:hypothetical protein
VDQLHVQRVADDEGDAVFSAAVGEPVPAEQALATDDDAVVEARDGLQQGVEVTRQVLVQNDGAGCVADADVRVPFRSGAVTPSFFRRSACTGYLGYRGGVAVPPPSPAGAQLRNGTPYSRRCWPACRDRLL